ncbi:portal protein [uncultured Akkermansia sp.]|uniref:portal protein n=1 Tax=uncultured Akkermansia sp. TaxID=512294 RepID=UPI002597EBD2|nr:portal protein [uncultured Akkermansia sp.]
MSRQDEADELVRLYNGLRKQRDELAKTWQFARWYLLPNRVDDLRFRPSDFVGRVRNGAARMACARLAGAHMSHIVTSHEPWFKWIARPGDVAEEDVEEANAWYGKCSDIALMELTRSNFYSEIYECFLDRVGMGTGSLYCGPGRSVRLLFKAISPEQVCGEVDDEGRVVVFVREMLLSAYDVADLFGKAALSEGMAADYHQGGAGMYEKKWVVLHVVRRAKKPKMGRGWESFYVDQQGKRVMRREMEWEMPYMATRWKMNGTSFFGFAPWQDVEGEVRGVEEIEKDLEKARRVAIDPRILTAAKLVGEVDLRAGGKTLVDPDLLQDGGVLLPKEWAAVGDVSLSYKQLADKEQRIKDAFLVPMLELFAYDEGKKGFPTATEVMARENQYLLQFFPSFVQFAYDVQPTLDRVFMVLYRAGVFPDPPDCVREDVIRNGAVVGTALKNPGVTYNNKVALVLKRIESDAFAAALREAVELGEAVPGLLDHLDVDRGMRARLRSLGVSEDSIRGNIEVEDMRRRKNAAVMDEDELRLRQAGAAVMKDEAAAAKMAAEAQGGAA